MKKVNTILAVLATAAALVAAPALFAENTTSASSAEAASDNYTTKDYNFQGFTKLDVGGRFDVILTKSSSYKVKITVPAEAENLIAVRVEEGTLKIGWNRNFTDRWQKKFDDDMKFTAEISMPVLKELEMAGATTFECEDKLALENDEFSLDISGASRVKSLKINARELDAEVSGASHCDLYGSFSRAEIEVSGAGTASFEITADDLDLDISGAATCDVEGEFGNVIADVSGASTVNLTGSAERLSADVSAASKLRAKSLEVKDVTVEATGASHCTVYATRSMTVEDASGASSIKYKAPKSLSATINSISRSSSVQRID